jgi:hypothetical protein
MRRSLRKASTQHRTLSALITHFNSLHQGTKLPGAQSLRLITSITIIKRQSFTL